MPQRRRRDASNETGKAREAHFHMSLRAPDPAAILRALPQRLTDPLCLVASWRKSSWESQGPTAFKVAYHYTSLYNAPDFSLFEEKERPVVSSRPVQSAVYFSPLAKDLISSTDEFRKMPL
jgi:hypothetical protein